MKVELIAFTPTASGVCCDAAAVCTASDNGYRSLQHSLASGHESVLEHAVFTFRIEGISRVTLAQLTRHRLASFPLSPSDMSSWTIGKPLFEYHYKVKFLQKADEQIRHSMECIGMVEAASLQRMSGIDSAGDHHQPGVDHECQELRHFFSLRCCNRAQWKSAIWQMRC